MTPCTHCGARRVRTSKHPTLCGHCVRGWNDANLALPAGRWVTNNRGVAHFIPNPDLERGRAHQEQIIAHILLKKYRQKAA